MFRIATETDTDGLERLPISGRIQDIHDELAPDTPLEHYFVEQIRWGVQCVSECQGVRDDTNKLGDDPEWWRKYERGQRVFFKHFNALIRWRLVRDKFLPVVAAPTVAALIENGMAAVPATVAPAPTTKGKAKKKSAAEPAASDKAPWEEITHRGSRRVEAPADWPVPVDTPEEIAEAERTWWDVIAYVPSVNDKWALHLPTNKPVEHVLALAEQVGDDRFLRNEPWLRPRDLAAMRACEKLGLHGRFYPMDPTPPGLRRLDAVPPEFLAIQEALRAGTLLNGPRPDIWK